MIQSRKGEKLRFNSEHSLPFKIDYPQGTNLSVTQLTDILLALERHHKINLLLQAYEEYAPYTYGIPKALIYEIIHNSGLTIQKLEDGSLKGWIVAFGLFIGKAFLESTVDYYVQMGGDMIYKPEIEQREFDIPKPNPKIPIVKKEKRKEINVGDNYFVFEEGSMPDNSNIIIIINGDGSDQSVVINADSVLSKYPKALDMIPIPSDPIENDIDTLKVGSPYPETNNPKKSGRGQYDL